MGMGMKERLRFEDVDPTEVADSAGDVGRFGVEFRDVSGILGVDGGDTPGGIDSAGLNPGFVLRRSPRGVSRPSRWES